MTSSQGCPCWSHTPASFTAPFMGPTSSDRMPALDQTTLSAGSQKRPSWSLRPSQRKWTMNKMAYKHDNFK